MVDEIEPTSVLRSFAPTLVTDFPIQDLLDQLVRHIVRILPIPSAGVTLLGEGRQPRCVAASNGHAASHERPQTDVEEGTCVVAFGSGELVRVADLTNDERFPAFTEAARSEGLGAAFTFPLHCGAHHLHALDLCRETSGDLDERGGNGPATGYHPRPRDSSGHSGMTNPTASRVPLGATTLRSLLSMMLHRTGRYEVVGEAGDGREALALAPNVAPDPALLDTAMPRMGGLEALPGLLRLVPQRPRTRFLTASRATRRPIPPAPPLHTAISQRASHPQILSRCWTKHSTRTPPDACRKTRFEEKKCVPVPVMHRQESP